MKTQLSLIALFVALGFASFVAWVTHVVATIQAGAYVLLAIGGIIAPIGVIHGVMIWFGVPWAG